MTGLVHESPVSSLVFPVLLRNMIFKYDIFKIYVVS